MLKIHYQYCFLCNILKNNKIPEKIVNKIKIKIIDVVGCVKGL